MQGCPHQSTPGAAACSRQSKLYGGLWAHSFGIMAGCPRRTHPSCIADGAPLCCQQGHVGGTRTEVGPRDAPKEPAGGTQATCSGRGTGRAGPGGGLLGIGWACGRGVSLKSHLAQGRKAAFVLWSSDGKVATLCGHAQMQRTSHRGRTNWLCSQPALSSPALCLHGPWQTVLAWPAGYGPVCDPGCCQAA